jgi:uncharacterized protein with HEPN domain
MPDKLGDKIRLQHILDAIEEIKSFIKDIGFEEFMNSSIIKSACVRQLEIIGEASNRLSEDLRIKNVDVSWGQIIGLRNILIHQYFGVDEELVWDIIQNDLPLLEESARKILEKASKD